MLGTGYSLGIDQIMFFGLGALVCALVAMLAVPFIHNRAVRLTEKKLDQANPISMQDIHSEKDMMRAEFAMTARRLETSIAELKNKTTAHLGEIVKKSNVIAKMKETLDQRDGAIATLEQNNDRLEARLKTLFDDLQIAKADAALRTSDAAQAERDLARAKSEISDLRLALDEREHLLDRQIAEIATLKSHVDMVRNRVAEFANEMRQREDRLANDRVDLLRVASPALSVISNGKVAPVNVAKANGAHHLNGVGAEQPSSPRPA